MKRLDILGARLLWGGRDFGNGKDGFRQRPPVAPAAATFMRQYRLPPHWAVRFLLASCLIAGGLTWSSWALALTAAEAAKVADVIAALQPAFGTFSYDEEISRDWFERDAEEDRLIQKAGFTAESWETAVGETFRGLVALMPQSEIDALRAKIDSSMAGFSQSSEEQRAELKQEFEAQFARMLTLRAEGAAFADAVRPVEQRLNALIQNPSE